jgi:cystathionine beta-lyase/cystathionine gamma-synthase
VSGERERIGISDSLLRLSAGIEQLDDLLEDIENGLNSAVIR